MPSKRGTGSDRPKFKDYWDMEIPQWALDLGFKDKSWHNDAGAFMHRTFQLRDGEVQDLQVFFADPEDKGDWLGYEYGVFLVPLDADMADRSDHSLTLYAGMNEAEARLIAGAFARLFQDLYKELT